MQLRETSICLIKQEQEKKKLRSVFQLSILFEFVLFGFVSFYVFGSKYLRTYSREIIRVSIFVRIIFLSFGIKKKLLRSKFSIQFIMACFLFISINNMNTVRK